MKKEAITIAIIGSGNVGGTLAKKWARAGHKIILGVRDLSSFKGKELLQLDGIQAQLMEEAVREAQVVLLATPAPMAVTVAKQLGDVSNKVIIDAMNVVKGRGPEGYNNTADALMANLQGGSVVKCFNTTGFNNMEDTHYGAEKLDAFMCGRDIAAKELVRTLALDADFANCYDIGGSEHFGLMEQFAWFWINLAMFQGFGREIGFKLLKR